MSQETDVTELLQAWRGGSREAEHALIQCVYPVLRDLALVEPLSGGPSRVVAADVIGLDGSRQRRVFVLAFDARWMYIYDPHLQRIEARLGTGRGPQGIAIDSARGLGYIVHFTDSFISVVDLDRRHATYGQVLMNVGTPTLPQAAN